MHSLPLLLMLATAAPPSSIEFDHQRAIAAPPAVVAVDVANLQEQLETGLKARRPSEFTFIGRVVAFVQTGKLSRQIVTETFQWARNKQLYPYPFFERAMKIRARKEGVAL